MASENKQTELNATYMPSEKVVPRQIGGKLIIVPIENGVADLNDEIYSLNETGVLVWQALEKGLSLNDICVDLEARYDAPLERIKTTVTGLIMTLLNKGIIVPVV